MHSLLFYLYINKNVGAAISRPQVICFAISLFCVWETVNS